MAVKKRKLQVTWQIDGKFVDKVKREAKRRGIAAQVVAQEALEQYFEK